MLLALLEPPKENCINRFREISRVNDLVAFYILSLWCSGRRSCHIQKYQGCRLSNIPVGGSSDFSMCVLADRDQRRKKKGAEAEEEEIGGKCKSRRRSGYKKKQQKSRKNTDTWLSVDRQGYTVVCEVSVTSSLFEYKMQMNSRPSWSLPVSRICLVWLVRPHRKGTQALMSASRGRCCSSIASSRSCGCLLANGADS